MTREVILNGVIKKAPLRVTFETVQHSTTCMTLGITFQEQETADRKDFKV